MHNQQKKKQLMETDIPNSYILADSMEFPIGKKLPIWIVGLLY